MDSTISITDISFQNLGELLLINLNFPVYNLTSEQQTVIQTFIQKSPAVLEKIAADILNITKDGKIDLHDIPFMVQLLADSYSSLSGDHLIVFIQYTVNIILDSKIVILPDYEKQMIETVLHVCIQLLRTNTLPKVNSWFSVYRCW